MWRRIGCPPASPISSSARFSKRDSLLVDAAKEKTKNDDLTMVDCANVLRAGVVEEPEFERGTWRYRVRTQRIFVVVAFGPARSSVS